MEMFWSMMFCVVLVIALVFVMRCIRVSNQLVASQEALSGKKARLREVRESRREDRDVYVNINPSVEGRDKRDCWRIKVETEVEVDGGDDSRKLSTLLQSPVNAPDTKEEALGIVMTLFGKRDRAVIFVDGVKVKG